MARRKRGRLKRWSERLTLGKLSLGRARRRSNRLKRYERPAALQPAPTLSIEPARARVWLRSRWSPLLLVGLVALLIYLLFGTSWFYIYDIEVEGARLLTKEEIYNRSNLEATSIFWLNPRAVARRLEEDPLVMRAVVSHLPPNRARIQIQERLPAVVWQTGEQSFYADREGVLFGIRNDAREMLVIRDMSAAPRLVGETVDAGAIQSAQELRRLLPSRRAFDWQPGVGLSFLGDEGWHVVFGDESSLPTKVNAYLAFQEQIHPEEEIQMLDLSAPEHPYYRVAP